MATWPEALQKKLSSSDFSLAPTETVIRTEMDFGPPKRRRRYTDSIENVRCSILLPFDEYQTLKNFYKVDCAGGSLPFDFTHPIEMTPTKACFSGPYTVVPIGGIMFHVTMQWEIFP